MHPRLGEILGNKTSPVHLTLIATYIKISIPDTQSRIIGAYRRPTLNYGGQLSQYVPHMLRVNMT